MKEGSNAAHVFISGVVQGVGYRLATREMATAHGLMGWVQNLPDGRVEAIFEGDAKAVDSAIRWCHQGPPGARVEDVVVTRQDPEGFKTFEIRR